MTEGLEGENRLEIRGLPRLLILQPLALSLCDFNQHLGSTMGLLVGYLECEKNQK